MKSPLFFLLFSLLINSFDFCSISASFQPLVYTASNDHIQGLLMLKSECFYHRNQYVAFYNNFMSKNAPTKMNRASIKLKFLDNEITLNYYLKPGELGYNKDTQRLTQATINQYGMENEIDCLLENHYILKDRSLADFPLEYILGLFTKELFIECTSSEEGNEFTCEIK